MKNSTKEPKEMSILCRTSLATLLLNLSLSIFIYFCFSFYNATFNPVEWGMEGRLNFLTTTLVIMALTTIIAAISIHSYLKDPADYEVID